MVDFDFVFTQAVVAFLQLTSIADQLCPINSSDCAHSPPHVYYQVMSITRKFGVQRIKMFGVARATSTCASGKESNPYIRNAQAAEIFRSSFYTSRNQETIIPLEDLDQLIVKDKVRPSIFVSALELTGLGLGLVSRFAPQSVSQTISEAVDDAAVQQFNDSIRDMQLQNIDDIDVKETLKYHRELRGGDAWDAPQEKGSAMPTMDAKEALTQVLYHSLKLSTKY